MVNSSRNYRFIDINYIRRGAILKEHLKSYLRVKGHKYHLYSYEDDSYLKPLKKVEIKELIKNQNFIFRIKEIQSTNLITNIYVRCP